MEEEERSGNNRSATAAAGPGAAQPGLLKGRLKAPLFTATPGSRGLELRCLKDPVFLLAPLIIYRYDDRNAVNRPTRSFLQSDRGLDQSQQL